MARYIQCRKTGKMLPAAEFYAMEDALKGRGKTSTEFTEFVSPIDKTIISDRRQLAAHNKKHGVTDMRDYTQSHFDKAHKRRSDVMTGATPEQKQERLHRINSTVRKHGM